jgi:hypothetical protein
VLSPTTSLSLPKPGVQGSLGINNRININTTIAAPPAVVGVVATVPSRQYQAGNTIPIQVRFSRAVVVTGTPQLGLATGSNVPTLVNYSGGSGPRTLIFNYKIAAGQLSARLDYASPTALVTPAGSTIKDALNLQQAILKLPVPGLAGSLSESSLLVVGNPVSASVAKLGIQALPDIIVAPKPGPRGQVKVSSSNRQSSKRAVNGLSGMPVAGIQALPAGPAPPLSRKSKPHRP